MGMRDFWSCSLPSLSLEFLEFQGNAPSLNTSSNCLAEMPCVYKSPKRTSLNRAALEKKKCKSSYFHTDQKTRKKTSTTSRTNSSHSGLSRVLVEHSRCSTPAFIITTNYEWNIRMCSSVIRRKLVLICR